MTSNWPMSGSRQHQGWCPFKSAISRAEAARLAALFDARPKCKATVGKEGALDPQARDSNILWIEPSPETEWIFDRVEHVIRAVNDQFFRLDLTHLPALQLTEYRAEEDGHYGQHIDCAYGENDPLSQRKLSISINLSRPSDYAGGRLLIYPTSTQPIACNTLVCGGTIFRSHIVHEVTPVTRGRRLSLVTWACGPQLR